MSDSGARESVNGNSLGRKSAIQVICLGAGGGPSEDNVTGILVRSTSSGWVKGSLLAVDAGSHLASITRILQQELPLVSRTRQRADVDGNLLGDQLSPRSTAAPMSSPPSSPPADLPPPPEPIFLQSGPFAGVPLPHASARANAAYIVRNHVSTYLITHPHLDHLSGFAINTAAFHATSRPKRLAALPSTVEAIKQHIFNDVIWPNLTDEDGGVGFVTFQRLKEGGDVMVGEGEGRGYIEVCEGLGAKGFKISHGKCMKPGPTSNHRGSLSNVSELPHGYNTAQRNSDGMNHGPLGRISMPETPNAYHSPAAHQYNGDRETGQVVDSTAYFIRDCASSREVLIFGDVEPDSVSIAPRLARVWSEAAPKIAANKLAAIFIECSYDDSQADAVLFGHLAPRHLVAELQVLSDMAREERAIRATERAMRKRKRSTANGTSISYPGSAGEDLLTDLKKRSRSIGGLNAQSELRRSSVPDQFGLMAEHNSPTPTPPHLSFPPPLLQHQLSRSGTSTPSEYPSYQQPQGFTSVGAEPGTDASATRVSFSAEVAHSPPLRGVRVIIIHVKDTLTDGPHPSELILAQLKGHAAELEQRGTPLGCAFEVAESGCDYWF